MTAYVTPICIDCRNFLYLREQRGLEEIRLVDITKDTVSLKEFLYLRDSRGEFAPCRAAGTIGVPCFIEGDRLTFEVDEALSWLGQPPVQEQEVPEHRN